MKKIFNKVTIIILLVILQSYILYVMVHKLAIYSPYFYYAFLGISIIAVIAIVNRNFNPSYKIGWIILVMLMPIFGGLFYFLFGRNSGSKKWLAKMKQVNNKFAPYLRQNAQIFDEIEKEDKYIAQQSYYILKWSGYPVYKKTRAKYLKQGEELFAALKKELNKAKHYIFIECFIIEEGEMWNGILDILKAKVKEGIDIRLIYDDLGCAATLPAKYNKKLEEMGIKCQVFNPVMPYPSSKYNNRDHRKLVIIDGHTGFFGGCNIGDEYINKKMKFGYLKDADLMIKGDAVWSLTVMFLQMWNFDKDLSVDAVYENCRPQLYSDEEFTDDGFIQPFADAPLDNENIGESVYLNMINKAKEYIYIYTPYLVIDNEMMIALSLAAQNGVDVRIVTPYIGDKIITHQLTRANYKKLIANQVKIYEYLPGFIHSKVMVSDDDIAVISTINMDFRSFYLHFECAALMYKTEAIKQMKEDYMNTLEVCKQITIEDCLAVKWYIRVFRSILKVLSPLI
jgi:cardiolipin synthase